MEQTEYGMSEGTEQVCSVPSLVHITYYFTTASKFDACIGLTRNATFFKLAIVKFSVEAFFTQQLLMAAAFYDITILHNQNYIGVFNGGQSVRNDKGGSS
ncbi:MAG: hypothetical protein SNH27_15995, partial [Rikenellaceae bacterium]